MNVRRDRAGEQLCVFRVREPGHHGQVEIEVAGELDLASSPELARLFEAHHDQERVVVDLSECTFADSTALNVLVRAHQASANGAPALMLRSPSEAVRHVMRICGLDQLLWIDDRVRGTVGESAT